MTFTPKEAALVAFDAILEGRLNNEDAIEWMSSFHEIDLAEAIEALGDLFEEHHIMTSGGPNHGSLEPDEFDPNDMG